MFYVTKLSDKKYRCNLCDCVFESKDDINVETLVEHFKADHKDVCELHKAELSPNVGFKIEFLQVVESSKQPVTQEITIQKDIDSTAVEDTENVHFVVINEDRTVQKKKKSESEGNETVSKFAKKKRSWVWKYFENISNFIFRCTLCNVVLSIKGSNTNNMNRHVKSKHPMVYKNELVLAGFTRKKESLEVTEVGSEVEITQSKVDLSDHDFAASTPMKADVSGDKDTSKAGRRSWIWGYFSRLSPTIAECTICKRKINHGGNATGNMNRHLKFLHKEIYLGSIIKSKHEEGKEIVDFVETEVDWVWTLFSTDDPVFYGCKICGFKCLKFNNISKSILFILEHLKTEHGVISGDQIISSPDAGDLDDECTIAVDFLKGTEEI